MEVAQRACLRTLVCVALVSVMLVFVVLVDLKALVCVVLVSVMLVCGMLVRLVCVMIGCGRALHPTDSKLDPKI